MFSDEKAVGRFRYKYHLISVIGSIEFQGYRIIQQRLKFARPAKSSSRRAASSGAAQTPPLRAYQLCTGLILFQNSMASEKR
jgi:hypothetical protein